MSALRPRPILVFCTLLLCPVASPGQNPIPAPRAAALRDRPTVAIIQYESGRVLIVREINGELLVTEPRNVNAATSAGTGRERPN